MPGNLNTIFRATHSIKGGAGTFTPLLKTDGLLFVGYSENFSHLERNFTLRRQTVYALSKEQP
ncbi:hypothetical protein BR191_000626 [Escherichia albertii]|nr:hypothetical protein [Escherichia albertii]EFZ2301688.1 hypothetical protein [Shigella boydii]EFZ6209525.1 hypothetical protein [Shigella boydii]EFZ6296294.1 hypothetical protein [Shigella boydii]EFZ6322693.1 hypothetical protein [Shigella boydii]